VILTLAGEIEMSSATDVSSGFDKACLEDPTVLIVDITGVSYCDSSGVRAFCDGAKRCRDSETPLRIIGAQRTVRRVFEICGLSKLLVG
jgi:anti-anti-sigma factor